MHTSKNGNCGILFALLIVINFTFTGTVQAEDKRSRFYAGPLSTVTETVVEKKEPVPSPKPDKEAEAIPLEINPKNENPSVYNREVEE